MTKSTATQQLSASERDAPIYKNFSELKDHGFRLRQEFVCLSQVCT